MTFASDARVFERPFGPGADVSLVGTGSGTGASPISITVPAGTTTGDIAVLAVMTVDSIPSAPTGGAAWNQLYLFDTSSNEYHGIWWKVCGGSEPASWSLTHSSGTDVGVAAAVFRADEVDSLYAFSPSNDTLQPRGVPGHPQGFQVLVWLSQDNTQLESPEGSSVITAINYQSGSTNNAQVVIAYRRTKWAGDGIAVRCTGQSTLLTGAFNMVFSP